MVAAERRRLDMAPNAVDHTFLNCTQQMMELVMKPGGILQEELGETPKFAQMWNKTRGTCKSVSPRLTPLQRNVLQDYGNSNNDFRKEFNELVQTKGGNDTAYVDGFPYKSLYFLLMDAMNQANPGLNCSTVYFGTKHKYDAKEKTQVRFGRFMRAKTQMSDALEDAIADDQGTLFEIRSCYMVNFDKFTCKSEEVNVLIPPTEIFRVLRVTDEETDDKEPYKKVILQNQNPNQNFSSRSGCHLVSRMKSSSSPLSCSVLLLGFSILVRLGV